MPPDVMDNYRSVVSKARETIEKRAQKDKIRIQVGTATCETAAGADNIADEFRKHIKAAGRDDIVMRRVGCTGRCSREPIVSVIVPGKMPIKYEQVTRDLAHEIFISHVQGGKALEQDVLDAEGYQASEYEVFLCGGPQCPHVPQWDAAKLFDQAITKAGLAGKVAVTESSCFG